MRRELEGEAGGRHRARDAPDDAALARDRELGAPAFGGEHPEFAAVLAGRMRRLVIVDEQRSDNGLLQRFLQESNARILAVASEPAAAFGPWSIDAGVYLFDAPFVIERD